MVNAVSAAAQQISTNLTKLKASKSSNEPNLNTDSSTGPESELESNPNSGSSSASLSSKVSSGLLRLQKTGGEVPDNLNNNMIAQIGVEVELSREAKALLKGS